MDCRTVKARTEWVRVTAAHLTLARRYLKANSKMVDRYLSENNPNLSDLLLQHREARKMEVKIITISLSNVFKSKTLL